MKVHIFEFTIQFKINNDTLFNSSQLFICLHVDIMYFCIYQKLLAQILFI